MPLRLARGTKITTLNQRAVRKDSPFHIRCDLCFPLLYPLRLFFRKGHQNYYAKSKQLIVSQLIVSHIRLNFVFPYGIPSDKTAPPNSPFCKVLSAKSVVPLRLARGTKITTLNQRAVHKDSPFHIRCDLCFPLLYPLPQKVSPRLNFLQGTFTFCKVLFTKSVVFVKREIICFPLRYPFRQNGSPQLAVLQGTFGKKRGFCRKKNN